MTKFKWTDESVQMFCRVYTAALGKNHAELFDLTKYKGLRFNAKVEMFKKDYLKADILKREQLHLFTKQLQEQMQEEVKQLQEQMQEDFKLRIEEFKEKNGIQS